MNEFFLYEQLCALEGIGKQYPQGYEYAQKVRAIADQLVSQTYRVAVVGEFKKGKSSLINALLGSSILPTDILPMTAAVNRVVYGEKERIVVQFKDGRSEERSVAELQEFGTKEDAEKEAVARTVREIQVYYPSVFCKNHIEVLDTPGMNDTEEMMEVTLGLLGEVDAVIFVVSVTSPLSMSEGELLLTLIGQPSIRHVIFAVTHIDLVKGGPEEQDRVVDLIRERASGYLERALMRFDGEEALLEKARRVLGAPMVYGVSSLLAMKGFVRDDEDLLDASRFPAFKNMLLAYLTAAQSTDMAAKTVDAAAEAARNLEGWYQATEEELARKLETAQDALRERTEYLDSAHSRLTGLFQKMDKALEQRGLSANGILKGAHVEAGKPFIAQLGGLRRAEATHENILRALREGKKAADTALAGACRSLESWIQEEMAKREEEFNTLRQGAGYSVNALRAGLSLWRQQTPFPSFHWTKDPVHGGADLSEVDVMPWVNEAIQSSLARFGAELENYIASWRLVLFQQVAADRGDILTDQIAESLRRYRQSLDILPVSYGQHRRQVAEIQDKLRSDP